MGIMQENGMLSATWENLSPSQLESFLATYASPVRRSVGGAWCPKHDKRPMARREAMTKAAVPWPETTIHLARLRLLPRLVKAPITLLALLQTAAADEWQQTIRNDLADLQALLPSLLASLPDPK